jgi:hypothetical protein
VYARKELTKANRKKEADQNKRAKEGGEGRRVLVTIETTSAATATPDGNDTSQTNANCILCVKASSTRPKGSRGLAGIPFTLNGCSKCKKQMRCTTDDCQAQLAMHAQYYAAVKSSSCELGIKRGIIYMWQ